MAWNTESLCITLKELTPKGFKKDEYGNVWAWSCGKTELQKRFVSFYKKWENITSEYTEDDVINAYKQYLQDTIKKDGEISKYRKLLKYFIWKEVKGGEPESLLVKYLEEPENTSIEITTMVQNERVAVKETPANESWVDELV